MDMHTFQGVTVGFPAGASAYLSKENWQSTRWVPWSHGDLRVDRASFGLIFSPAGAGRLAAKPLGCLTGVVAVAAAEPGALGAFVATTNDPVHSLVRLSFQTRADDEAFAALAQAAEEAASSCLQGCGARRSTLGRRSSSSCGPRGEGPVEALAAHVAQQYPGSSPLVFGGAELYGPDPHGESGSEVLLGRGAVVLLDPPDAGRVGSYQVFFYEESSMEPSLRFAISPRTKLSRQPDDGPIAGSGQLSTASRRLTLGGWEGLGPCCCPVAFSLELPGAPGWAITFDSETAAGFERDFLVRQRLVALSLKTSRGWRTVGELQEEIMEMRRHGLFATLQWLVMQAFVVLSLLLVLYAAVLYSNDPDRPLLDIVTVALQDASATAMNFGESAAEVGASACGLLMQSVPVAAVGRCVALPDAIETRSCVAALIPGTS